MAAVKPDEDQYLARIAEGLGAYWKDFKQLMDERGPFWAFAVNPANVDMMLGLMLPHPKQFRGLEQTMRERVHPPQRRTL